MCILFLAVTSDDHQVDGHYKLILAANRDEYFHRPTKVADFWDEDPKIVGGRDMEPGREGGTWLAMHKNGKIGVLLNILVEHPATDKLGRGSLVTDYLKMPDFDGFQYCKNLAKNASLYNDFNLVTLNVKEPEPTVIYFSNASEDIVKLKQTGKTISAFGNSLINTPYLKVIDGKEKVAQLVDEFPRISQKEQLLSGLLEILKNKQRFYPDPEMQKQVENIQLLTGLSSRFTEIPELNYGSRTHTVILVDFENQVEFHEWTMEEPIVATNPKWIHSEYKFRLE